MPMDRYALFATCQGGLEDVLEKEVQDLGFFDVVKAFRGVHFQSGDFTGVMRANYLLRTASRVLLPLCQAPCRRASDLYDAALDLVEWELFFEKGASFCIDVSGRHSAFRNTLYAAQLVKDAICDSIRRKKGRQRPSVDLQRPDVRLRLFLQEGKASLFFDASGSPLYKRGWRNKTGPAPLQESLAASLLLLLGYPAPGLLLDPCAGSGTLLVEAAMMVSRTPAGYFRSHFGFMAHPEFSRQAWLDLKQQCDAGRLELSDIPIVGMEQDAAIAQIAKDNVEAAGFSQIKIYNTDFRQEFCHDSPSIICTNPPHGKRIADHQITELYGALGDFFKQKMKKPGVAGVFVGDTQLGKCIGLKPQRRHILHSSGQDCRFLQYDIY